MEAITFNIKQLNISMGYNLNFLPNNVNGLNSSKKRIKMFKYFREETANNGMLFSQETHSYHGTLINWRNDFKCELIFFPWNHEFLRRKKIKVNRIKNDNQSRILIVDADIDEETFVLINLYNASNETEQIKTIYEFDQLLGDFYLGSNKKIIFAGDFNLFFNRSLEAPGGKTI